MPLRNLRRIEKRLILVDSGSVVVFALGFLLIASFLFVVGVIVWANSKYLERKAYDDAQPMLSAPATVVAKRIQVSGGGNDTMASTAYFVTFELPSGERREHVVHGQEYGLLAEEDEGTFTYQGSRYKGFVRTVKPA